MSKTSNHLDILCQRYPALSGLKDSIAEASKMIIKCYSAGGKLLVCGNGGSSADAEHFTAELMKSFEKERRSSLGRIRYIYNRKTQSYNWP